MLPATHQQDMTRLKKIVDEIRVGMLTTIESDGTLHSRPMANRCFEPQGILWFFTYESSHKVSEVEQNHQVSMSYASPAESRYVSVSGTAEIVTDRRRMEELWDDTLKAWFPDGLAEPDVALLKVSVERAEFWDGLETAALKVQSAAKMP